jgi:tetratricopeptide (TPR) repeat protein
MCERALALDPDLPEGRYLRGLLLWSPQAGFDHAGALRELASAIRARPGLDDTQVRLGVVLMHVGLLDEALEVIGHALRISPDHLVARSHEASCFFAQGRISDALEVASMLQEQMPSYWVDYLVVHCHLRQGDRARAEIALARMARDVPYELTCSVRALMAALDGRAEDVRQFAEQTERGRKPYTHYHHGQYDLGCAAAVLGRSDEAVAWLRAAAGNGFPCLPLFETEPWLASLRGHRGFEALLDELRLERAGYARLYRELVLASPALNPST